MIFHSYLELILQGGRPTCCFFGSYFRGSSMHRKTASLTVHPVVDEIQQRIQIRQDIFIKLDEFII